jgi:multicomponent Na+:H+ antiporter subunit D
MITFFVGQESHRLRNALSLGGAVLKVALIVAMLVAVARGASYETEIPLAPGLVLLLRIDALALLFVSLSAVLWLLTTIYAIAYFGTKPELSRFFGFFSLCVAATTGIALSGSLISFFIFFELLTLSTWPLVAHKQDEASLEGGAALPALCAALQRGAPLGDRLARKRDRARPVHRAAGSRRHRPGEPQGDLRLFIVGVGMKAAIVPLHGWLPEAMAAPAPVSALLHAVAVVKAGAFGVIRVIYDVFGVERVAELGVGIPLAALASATIIWGSLRALQQDGIKKRLAYSTVSQVSYIVLGAALASPFGIIGGLAHLVHQGLMKITLFFCAGIYDERAGVRTIGGLNGLGPRMPWTSTCFSLGALGMIGLPPLAGFVSKIYLGLGGLQADAPWVLAVLAASTLLNAAYFLPLLYRLWFLEPCADARGDEKAPALVGPAVIAALGALGAGLLAASPLSPLDWARLIAERGGDAMTLWTGPLLPLVALVWPLLLAALTVLPALRGRAVRLLPLAPAPALWLAATGTGEVTTAPDLLLGVTLGLDDARRLLLGMAAALWLLAGLAAQPMAGRPHTAVFAGFWCLTLTGNLGVFLALDVVTFYVAFAAVSLSAWFLVVHDRTEPALRAGRVYIVMAIAGEVFLLLGLLLGAAAAGGTDIAAVRLALGTSGAGPVAIALLVAGFGIKAGLVPLHVWLPLAHPAAPVPASAVLSGAIVKAGLFGLIVFLPDGGVRRAAHGARPCRVPSARRSGASRRRTRRQCSPIPRSARWASW